jgi:hypothetical protein
MEPLAVIVGVLLVGFAAYAFSDPMSRSRNWVSGQEWEDDPERAREKQRQYTFLMSIVVAGFGLFFIVFGVTAG